MPVQSPWASMSCQYDAQRDVIINPKTTRNVPRNTSDRAWPRSNSGPAKMVVQQRRKASMEPIQEIAEVLEESSRVEV